MAKLTKNPLEQLEYIQTNKDKALEALSFYLDYMSTAAAYGMYACLINNDPHDAVEVVTQQVETIRATCANLIDMDHAKLAQLTGFSDVEDLKAYIGKQLLAKDSEKAAAEFLKSMVRGGK